MADITIQKQGEVFISQSEYDALILEGNLQSNTKYHITKTPKTATEDFVNNGFVAKVTTGNKDRVYTVDINNQQVMLDISYNPSAWTIPRRYEDGRLQVGTPVGVNDATTKAYVDAIKRYFHHITVACGAGIVYFTIETTDGTAIDTQEALISLFNTLSTAFLSATGHIGGNMVYAVYGGETMYVQMYNFTEDDYVAQDFALYGELTVRDMVL